MVSERHKKTPGGEGFPGSYPFRIIDKSGKEALSILKSVASKEPFDLLLTDFQMPGMSGFELEINVTPFSWLDKPATLCFLTDISERMRVPHQPAGGHETFNQRGISG